MGKICIRAFIVVFSALVVTLNAVAESLDWAPMPDGIDPVLDGSVTDEREWAFANWTTNDELDGTYYAEWQQDWNATSSSGNSMLYLGVTLFDLHNMDAAVTQEPADYNVFQYSIIGGDTVTAWVFANDNETDDSGWLPLSGLGSTYTSVDDVGFIVRLNNDPSSDRQWHPGDFEPGDADFNWTDWYGFFGTWGFNNSAFEMDLPGTPLTDGANEIYEVALYGLAFGSGGGGGFVPCATDINRTVVDPKGGNPLTPLATQMNGQGHVNAVVPEPASVILVGTGLFLVGAWKKRLSKV